MAAVETVTGPVDADQLGTTLIHEHLRTRDEAVHEQWPQAKASGGIPEREHDGDGYEAAIEVAKAAVELGVKTICDPTAMFLGRDVEFMRRVSEQTGLQVVPCTGIYTYDHLPPFFVGRDPDQIAELFVADIEQGIQGTEIKAAFIKCAADEPGVTENVEKVHRAAARASLRTGRPIMAHSRPASETAPRQIEIFLEEGVEPSKIQIAHTGDTDDLDYIERVLETGVRIGLDRYGLEMFLPYERRQATTLELLERGYAERVFLSADSCGTIDWFPQAVIEQMLAGGMAKDWDIRIVPERVLPDLREAGLTEDQERTIMVANPVAWLTG
ncbi:MAG: phosphotriesterase-related protein [Solirubrobacterales bacterium]|jgi:phosphotriesterase-related protein|nr:phosphotriesterase-related protein [Solirubrobacterales bacterium]